MESLNAKNWKSFTVAKPLSAVKYDEDFLLRAWFIDNPPIKGSPFVIEGVNILVLRKRRYSRQKKAWEVKLKNGKSYNEFIPAYTQVLIQPRVRKVTWTK